MGISAQILVLVEFGPSIIELIELGGHGLVLLDSNQKSLLQGHTVLEVALKHPQRFFNNAAYRTTLVPAGSGRRWGVVGRVAVIQ